MGKWLGGPGVENWASQGAGRFRPDGCCPSQPRGQAAAAAGGRTGGQRAWGSAGSLSGWGNKGPSVLAIRAGPRRPNKRFSVPKVGRMSLRHRGWRGGAAVSLRPAARTPCSSRSEGWKPPITPWRNLPNQPLLQGASGAHTWSSQAPLHPHRGSLPSGVVQCPLEVLGGGINSVTFVGVNPCPLPPPPLPEGLCAVHGPAAVAAPILPVPLPPPDVTWKLRTPLCSRGRTSGAHPAEEGRQHPAGSPAPWDSMSSTPSHS